MCEPRKPAPPVTMLVVMAAPRIAARPQAGSSRTWRCIRVPGAASIGRGVESLVDPSVARSRAAVSLLDAHAPALRRCARRVSICPDDADEALQRATLILLTKAPPHPPARLAGWMHVVTRREALALRRERERLLGAEVGELHREHTMPGRAGGAQRGLAKARPPARPG